MIAAFRRSPRLAALALAATLATSFVPLAAPAQTTADARLKKVEAEIRALQRKVFPEGASRYFEAEIRPPSTGPGTPPATSGAVTDLLARVDTIETQLARLTSQIEENNNRTGKLEARLAAIESMGAAAPSLDPAAAARLPNGATGANTAAMAQGVAAPPADRLAAVAGIVKPVSDDPGEDEYLYGYRLWQAGLYPEAAQQLKATIAAYPRHARISYARNLLGRAYLDDDKPGTAAQILLQNYQADRKGARAPDSLLNLAVAMTRLKETQRACVALQELREAYPAEVAGRLAPAYADARGAVSCK
jgi:TolA-binding protein